MDGALTHKRVEIPRLFESEIALVIRDNGEHIAKELAGITSILEYDLKSRPPQEIHDIYYDTKQGSLRNKQINLRVRKIDNALLLSSKSNPRRIGKAGQDPFGTAYLRDLESLRVAARVEFDESASTGFVISLVEPEGHRTMLVSRGATDNLGQQEVKSNLQKLGPAKFVYLSGYSLLNLPQREAVLEAGRIGRGNGSGVVFDPGSANLVKDHPDVFEEAIDSCDVLCANVAESKVLANGLSVSEYARSLSRKGKKVIVKAGPQGCVAFLKSIRLERGLEREETRV